MALLITLAAAAAEHHGFVKFGGLPLPGAAVTASQGDRKLTAITDDQGLYSFPDLPDGAWTLRVEMLCFEPMERQLGIAPESPAGEWEMKLLPMEQIMASATPPTAPAPAAAQPAPAPRRNATPAPAPSQTQFQRAAVNASPQAGAAFTETSASETDSSQGPSDGFLINGSVNNGAASPFAQAAAFGNNRFFGRSIYTGAIGLTADNSFWDARSYSLTGQDTPKPSYRRLQGTATFGGPLKIPYLLPRNGPMLNISYQWTRNRNATTQSALVPTDLERSGDFSQTVDALHRPVVIYDPATHAPFPGNAIPDYLISAQAKALLGLFPGASLIGNSQYNYQTAVTSGNHSDNLQGRANKGIGAKTQLAGSFAWQNARLDNASLLGFLDNTHSAGINGSFSWSRRFLRSTYLTIQFQYSRSAARVIPFFAFRQNVSGDAEISGNNQEPANWGPPSLQFSSGIAGVSDAQSSYTRDQTSGVSPSVLWYQGTHTVKYGGSYRRQQFNYLSQQDARGAFTFTGATTAALANGSAVAGTGSAFADFLLGVPAASAIAFGNADKYLHATAIDAYVTDDWRVSPWLTVNAGFRWEYWSPITEKYGRLVNLDLAPAFTAAAPVVASDPIGKLTGRRYPGSLMQADRGVLQPRIGIAWRPSLASSLLVRAGYGIYSNSSPYQNIALQMAQQPPLSKSFSVSNSAANTLTLANGFDISLGSATNTYAVDPNFRVGYAQNWQLSMQRDLPGSLVVTLTYLGVKGTHAMQTILPNTYAPGAADPCPSCPSGFTYLTSGGNSTRQSGQIQLNRRLRAGLTATLQYTFAKAIDNAALGAQGKGGTLVAQDWRNMAAERALSNFDQRHLVNFSFQYTTGMGLGGGTLLGGWRGRMYKDWTLSAQLAAGSGQPLTAIYSSAIVPGTGISGSVRPNYTGAALYGAPPGYFLNPAAVGPPAAGQWGNAGRNSITGPSQFSLNANLLRTFRVSDRISADLQVTATNVLNHAVFGSWVTNAASSQFGTPASPNAMRSMQLGMRARF